jgi:hypothetical protein
VTTHFVPFFTGFRMSMTLPNNIFSNGAKKAEKQNKGIRFNNRWQKKMQLDYYIFLPRILLLVPYPDCKNKCFSKWTVNKCWFLNRRVKTNVGTGSDCKNKYWFRFRTEKTDDSSRTGLYKRLFLIRTEITNVYSGFRGYGSEARLCEKIVLDTDYKNKCKCQTRNGISKLGPNPDFCPYYQSIRDN